MSLVNILVIALLLVSLDRSSCSCLRSRFFASNSTLPVVHNHGPCSPHSRKENPDLATTLRLDQERVESIHAKLAKIFVDGVSPSEITELPAKDGRTIGGSNYVVTIGIGTPKHDVSLAFDTGSSLTWIQCEPCAGACYPQMEPIFDPSSSSSFSGVSCSSQECASLTSGGIAEGCLGSNCGYNITYEDKSFTKGFIANERLTLTKSVVLEGFKFGCSKGYGGNFRGIAGLLGLGPEKLSFPSQTAEKYNNIFSYCLPSSPRYTGHLTFGSAGISKSVRYIPLSPLYYGSPFYGIDIVAIYVDGKNLGIPLTVFSIPGSIIDSGTVISRLPPKAYQALQSEFKAKMSDYKATLGVSVLDTCYDFTGVDLAKVRIPKVSFEFNGGTVLDLAPVGVMAGSVKVSCLAFAANSDDGATAIFGNIQQLTMQVVYDGPSNRLGFGHNGCN